MNLANKLDKAKIQLLLKEPFFASVLLNLKLMPANVPTACTDGINIQYSESFFEKLSVEEVKTVLAHEVMHVALLHTTRRGERHPKIWNHAADYVINYILEEANFRLPEGALINDDYAGMSSEEVYEIISKEYNSPEEMDNTIIDNGNLGTVEDSPEEAVNREEEIKNIVYEASMIAKSQGNLPGGLSEYIEGLFAPQINWKEVLSEFIIENVKGDYNFSYPNRRYIHSGIYLPSLHSEQIGDVYLFIDTSASVLEEELRQFTSEIMDILCTFKKSLNIIYCDTEISHTQEIHPDEEIKFEIMGRGGTDFRPPFLYLEENDITPLCAIYFTDGECSDFPDEPDYPTLWCKTESYFEFNPPFGETLHIELSN